MLSMVLILASHTLSSPALAAEDSRCMGCHERVSLVRADTLGGGWAVALTPESYARGSHGSLSCGACHGDAFSIVPHPPGQAALSCRACHPTDPTECGDAPMEAYESAARGDVHRRILGDGFTCASCHDPHSASVAPCPDIHKSNAVCRSCHRPMDIVRTHYWLPSAGLHLRRTGCTACHWPPGDRGENHAVLPKALSLRDCRPCHSREQALIRFGDRAAAWEGRGVPGWRGHPRGEAAAVGGAVCVTIAMLLVGARLRWRPTMVVAGPAALVRVGAALALLVTGAAIYFGEGWMLKMLSHVHVLAGMLLVAAYAEPLLLLARRDPRSRALRPSVRIIILAILSISGMVLLLPTVTCRFDDMVPVVRHVHRAAAVALALWIAAAVTTRQIPRKEEGNPQG